MKHLSPWILLALIVNPMRLRAQGYIVANGITFFGGNNTVTVLQSPTSGDYTGFSLVSQNLTRFQFSPFLDEGVRTFLVSANDPINVQAITANSYPELTYPNTYLFPNQTTFYLGFFTGGGYPVNGVYSDPLFGWGQFRNVNGAITFLGGALEYGGGGIYAGTQTIIPVPEPTALCLIGIGVSVFWFGRRKPFTTASERSTPQQIVQ